MSDALLQELADKQAITEILYLYARGWDRMDEAAIRACFHEDSSHKHGAFEGLSQDFVGVGMEMCAEVSAMSHMIMNPMIVVRGDTAVSECSFLAHQRRPGADGKGEDMFLKGRYLDRFERRGGTWKIARRVALHDFERFVPPAERTLADAPKDQLSRFKPADPLYALLESI